MNLLSVGNPKTLKGMKSGYNTYILHLAPASLSGHNVCPKATPGCIAACLNTAGRGGMFKKGENTNTIQKARIRKTQLFYDNRDLFMELLVKDINLAIKQSARMGLTPVIRLNGTSDISSSSSSRSRGFGRSCKCGFCRANPPDRPGSCRAESCGPAGNPAFHRPSATGWSPAQTTATCWPARSSAARIPRCAAGLPSSRSAHRLEIQW